MATFKLFRKLTLVSVVLPAFQARTVACSVPDELAMLAFVRVKEPKNMSIICPLLEHSVTPSSPSRNERFRRSPFEAVAANEYKGRPLISVALGRPPDGGVLPAGAETYRPAHLATEGFVR